MVYQGKFIPKNLNKYRGDYNNIYYRSSWELALMNWCDKNSNIEWWSSEELYIPYLCPLCPCQLKENFHRYFIDFVIKFENKAPMWVEVKPNRYTRPPKPQKRQTKKYLAELFQYAKNQSKWEAAAEAAEKNGAKFLVWTEDTLKKLGIKLMNVK